MPIFCKTSIMSSLIIVPFDIKSQVIPKSTILWANILQSFLIKGSLPDTTILLHFKSASCSIKFNASAVVNSSLRFATVAADPQ